MDVNKLKEKILEDKFKHYTDPNLLWTISHLEYYRKHKLFFVIDNKNNIYVYK